MHICGVHASDRYSAKRKPIAENGRELVKQKVFFFCLP